MSVNQTQIAQALGVSQRTVSAALAGTGRISTQRRAHIRQAARRLGYRVNSAARAQRTQRFDAIGLLLSTDEGRSHLPGGLFNGIHDALRDHGMHLAIAKLPDEELMERGVFPKILQQWCCDGLLVNYTDRLPAGIMARLNDENVPSIWMNHKQPTDAVYYDDARGAREATEQLLALGHRRVMYLDFIRPLGGDEMHYSRADRREGYAAAMRNAGLTPLFSDDLTGTPIEGRLDALTAMLSTEDRPSAILTYDAAHRVLYAAALAQVRVPEELSIVSFGEARTDTHDGRGEMFLGRSVTQMGLPTIDAGRQAVSMLLKKIERPSDLMASQALPLVWQEGDTCGEYQPLRFAQERRKC